MAEQVPWPSWLAGLSPDDQVRKILVAHSMHIGEVESAEHRLNGSDAASLLLRLLDEARQQAVPSAGPAQRCLCEPSDPSHPGPDDFEDCHCECHDEDEPAPVPSAEHAQLASLRERINAALDASVDSCARCKVCDNQLDAVMAVVAPIAARLAEFENAANWGTTCTSCAAVLDSSVRETERAERAEAQLAQAVAALRRLALDEPMSAEQGGGWTTYAPWREAEMTARREHAAGALETIARLGEPGAEGYPAAPEPAAGAIDGTTAPHGGGEPAEAVSGHPERSEAQRLVDHISLHQIVNQAAAQMAAGQQLAEGGSGPPGSVPPLVPEGTYVHAAIKGFIERDGYLFTGEWLGDPHMVVLRDKDGAFAHVFPRSSVHLISAQPEPGSEPEQPDPWAPSGELEAARDEVAASRRLVAAAHMKIAALGGWAAEFAEGDSAALAEVRAVLERDFTPDADAEEPPF